MGVVMFYHLTHSGAIDTLMTLMPRALAQGWRVMVKGGNPAHLAKLDDDLWLHPDDGFFPHGMQGGPQDADQPVLLGTGPVTNGAQGVFLIDGAPITADEARPLERVWLLFDGHDPAAVAAARDHWKALTGAGLAAQYWAEEDGRWQKKSEKAAG